MFKNYTQQPDPATVLFAISDATGQTALRVLQAALVQFPDVSATIRTVNGIREPGQIEDVVDEAARLDASIVYTLVKDDLRRHIYEYSQQHDVHAIDLLEPLLVHLQDILGQSPAGELGMLANESFRRGEAMSFTVKHDDGQRPEDLPRAETVLVGASRTSKTPISVYLSYHGWRVANLPISPEASPPEQLFEVDRHKVIGLTIEPARLQMLRRVRVRHMGVQLPDYTDLSKIRLELMHVLELCHEHGWRVVDVTDRSVEEAAVEIINLVEERPRFGV